MTLTLGRGAIANDVVMPLVQMIINMFLSQPTRHCFHLQNWLQYSRRKITGTVKGYHI